MNEMQKSWEEKLQDATKKQADVNKNAILFGPPADLTKPHIMNVSEDSLLTGKVIYDFEKEPIRVGKKSGKPVPQIMLGSIAISPNHAVFEKANDQITLSPCAPECAENIFVNGKKIAGKVVLQHGDRIVFGTNSAFIFKEPSKAAPNESQEVDYEAIMQEKYEKSEGQVAKQLQEASETKEEEEKKAEYERIKKELEEKAQTAAEEKVKGKQAEYEAKLRELEDKAKKEQDEKQSKKLQKKEMNESKFMDEKLCIIACEHFR